MKKFLLALLALAVLAGCNPEKDPFETADKIRASIRIIVTDPEVRPLIEAKTLEKLATAETVFLQAKAIHDKVGTDDPTAIKDLVTAADMVVAALGEIELEEKHRRALAAVRVSLGVMRNFL